MIVRLKPDELKEYAENLTQRDRYDNVTRAGFALGSGTSLAWFTLLPLLVLTVVGS